MVLVLVDIGLRTIFSFRLGKNFSVTSNPMNVGSGVFDPSVFHG